MAPKKILSDGDKKSIIDCWYTKGPEYCMSQHRQVKEKVTIHRWKNQIDSQSNL